MGPSNQTFGFLWLSQFHVQLYIYNHDACAYLFYTVHMSSSQTIYLEPHLDKEWLLEVACTVLQVAEKIGGPYSFANSFGKPTNCSSRFVTCHVMGPLENIYRYMFLIDVSNPIIQMALKTLNQTC